MKISDEGLEQILSLGLKKETTIAGVYFLYEWDNVKYLGVPNLEITLPQEYLGSVKILLSPKQFEYIEKLDNNKKNNPSVLSSDNFKTTTDYFENLMLLTFNAETALFSFKDSYGSNKMLSNFQCGINSASPLKIIYDTKKPFHGLYHPVEQFDECLKLVYIDTNNLWITAYPLVSGGVVIGATFAYTNKARVAVDVIEEFKKSENDYIKALAL